MKVYGIAGWKNSGKTGLVTRLVTHFVAQNLRVASVKHAHHSFDVDHEGRDSYRHRQAGAAEVCIVSPKRLALMRELDGPEPPLDEVLGMLQPADLVLVEGYKTSDLPKVEAHRGIADRAILAQTDPTIRAVASDSALEVGVPLFDLDDTAAIAAFIAQDLGL